MKFIAQRCLLFSQKESPIRKKLSIGIGLPYIVKQEDVDFPVDGTIAGCRVEISGLDEQGFDVYGVDTLQAINMASDIEPLLTRLLEKYDFFWETGEPYFEQ